MKFLKKSGVIIGVIVFVLFLLKLTSPILRIDGYWGAISELIMAEADTKYAKNYTHKNFLKIKEGMSELEVIEILGEPLVRWNQEENTVCFQYSKSPSSTNYHLRQVYFINRKVNKITAYYYID